MDLFYGHFAVFLISVSISSTRFCKILPISYAFSNATDEEISPVQERKYIVFESKLLQLFQTCPVCSGDCQSSVKETRGTLVSIIQICKNCIFEHTWHSQPFIHQMPVGNLLLSAAILMTGSLPTKALRMLDIIGIKTISYSTYMRQQTNYICPIIISTWKKQQEDLINHLAAMDGGGIIISGDARCDSPG